MERWGWSRRADSPPPWKPPRRSAAATRWCLVAQGSPGPAATPLGIHPDLWTDEKEVVAVAAIADQLKQAFARAGAVMLQPHQTEKLRARRLEQENGPRKHVIQRRYVGKNLEVVLRDARIPCDPARRLAVCEVDHDHPFLWTEPCFWRASWGRSSPRPSTPSSRRRSSCWSAAWIPTAQRPGSE